MADLLQPRRQASEFRVGQRMVQAVSAGNQTSMLLSYIVPRWPDRMKVGFTFTMATKVHAKARHWATVEVAGVCIHGFFNDIPTCGARHDPSRVNPERTGWAHIKNAVLHAGKASPDMIADRVQSAWQVVDFVCVDSGRENVKRPKMPRQYRNPTERELAEDNQYYEWLKLSAAAAGEEREPSLDELEYRARSAAYSRKLTAALAGGADTSTLTVSAEEVAAELPRILRRTGR